MAKAKKTKKTDEEIFVLPETGRTEALNRFSNAAWFRMGAFNRSHPRVTVLRNRALRGKARVKARKAEQRAFRAAN